MKILLIIASGKSSRFGGFPKAFCQIGDKTNVENTIQMAQKIFDKIYLGVNRNTYTQFVGKIGNCEMFSIVTGQGDAHSILKCMDYVKHHEKRIDKLAVCWGDAIFVNSLPFEQLLEGSGDAEISVACSMNKNPYAWFETNNRNEIIKTHFADKEGYIERALHDQSLFLLNFDFAWKYLNEYRRTLGIPYNNDENTVDTNEMKLLFSFEYLKQAGYALAKCVEVTAGNVFSFNTKEELNTIKMMLE